MTLQVGDNASLTRIVSAKDVRAFAELVGDNNPIHLDPAFAATTPFKRCIAHGMFGTSLISTLLATRLPGPGTIYLSQQISFKKPVFVDDTLTVSISVKAIRPDKPIVTMECVGTNQAGEVVMSGEATVMAPKS